MPCLAACLAGTRTNGDDVVEESDVNIMDEEAPPTPIEATKSPEPGPGMDDAFATISARGQLPTLLMNGQPVDALCLDRHQNSQDGCAYIASEEHAQGPVPGTGSLEVGVRSQNSQDGIASIGSEEHAQGAPGIGSMQVFVGAKLPPADDVISVTSGQSKRSSHSKRSSQSAQLVFETADKVKRFTKEVVGRLLLTTIILFILGYSSGGLLNWSASHLLDKVDAVGWKQPWIESRARDLKDPLLNNQTYVKIFSAKHRNRDADFDFPKFGDFWIYVFYLRMGVAMSIGYGAPWFIMLAIHGPALVWKYMAACYTPFVVFSFIISVGNAVAVTSSGTPLLSGVMEVGSVGLLSLVEAFVVLPLVGRRMGLKHMYKIVILPFLLMNAGLFVLKFGMPLIIVHLDDFGKVAFRLIVYAAVMELFVGKSRMACRLVPLADEEQYRPEDKVFAVLPLDCLFGYWGRIILMDLTSKNAILLANGGNALLELLARVTVVQRDKFYLGMTWVSWERRDAYWSTNAKGMMRFRCSMIISHLFTEYLMIAAAASFYWKSGIAKDLQSHIFNCTVQVVSELMVDIVTLCLEIRWQKLPVVAAWFHRQKHWGLIFGLFVVGFNLFAISQAGQYFCAMRKLGDPDTVKLLYCGAPK